jgi:hypothetical protein
VLQRLALGGDLFTYGALRRAKAGAREGLVHLRYIEWRKVHCSQNGRSIRWQLAINSQALNIIENLLNAKFESQTRSRNIV